VIRPFAIEKDKINSTNQSCPWGGATQESLCMKIKIAFVSLIASFLLQGCAVVAVADAVASAVVYTGKTVINVVDAVTPDIINKKKSD
jgi:hypothetical protein